MGQEMGCRDLGHELIRIAEGSLAIMLQGVAQRLQGFALIGRNEMVWAVHDGSIAQQRERTKNAVNAVWCVFGSIFPCAKRESARRQPDMKPGFT